MDTSAEALDKKGLISWALFDWANSAFPTIIITFIFATYFTQGIATDKITGTAQWGYAMSLSALGVAFFSPFLGAIADQTGSRKPWLMFFTLIAVTSSGLLWFSTPDTSSLFWVLIFVGLGNFAFEAGMVFYNAMLPDISPKRLIGRISGWAWGAGYAGGLICLVIALIGFVQTDVPWFGITTKNAEHIRATSILVAVWYLVFSLPLFLFTSDKAPTHIGIAPAISKGVSTLLSTLIRVRHYKQIVRYLFARMLYTDGLNTLFAFGGIYAAGTFGFTFTEIIQFGIAINVTSGLGAAGFAWIDDWIGPKKTIIISITALIILGLTILTIESKILFWIFGLMLGIFVGPAQAASRSLMAHLAPPELRTEMFGLYSFAGKATAFLGPAAFAVATDFFQSQRAGMATIIIFFVIGGLFLVLVDEPNRVTVD